MSVIELSWTAKKGVKINLGMAPPKKCFFFGEGFPYFVSSILEVRVTTNNSSLVGYFK